jgi:cytochrome b6-f complex iron-sulfur subunit
MTTPTFTRRDVLAASAAGIALTVLAGCPSNKDKSTAITTGTIDIGPASDYPAGTVSTKFLADHGIAIVNQSGPVVAVNPKCTHLGCMTAWKPEINQFLCPCHKSQFNILGQPTKGPATKPMAAIAAEAKPDGTLSVNLDKLFHA